MEQIEIIRDCLNQFCVNSGQRVNYQKSTICFSKTVPDQEAMMISQAFGVPLTTNMGRYLRIPSIHGRVKAGTYQELLDKVNSKIQSWKMRFLSLAGRHTLIQSVISSIPSFQMQSALLRKGLCNTLDMKARNFEWGDTQEQRKTYLVNWNMVTRGKERGGMGIRKMQAMNTSFMAKLGWKILTEKDNFG